MSAYILLIFAAGPVHHMLPPLLLLLIGPGAQGQVQSLEDQGLTHSHEAAHHQGQEDGPMACLGTGACYQVHCYGSNCKTFSDQLQVSPDYPHEKVSPPIKQEMPEADPNECRQGFHYVPNELS